MPASAAVATFSFKNIQANLPPADVDVGFATSIRKKYGDVTLSLSFTDATLKSPSSGQGIVVTADKPVGDGIKAALSYDMGKRSGMATMTLDKTFGSGSSLNLRAIYKQSGDVFILEENWKLDANNKIAGTYNFATEEATFAYTHSKGDWSATGRYNFAKESTIFDVQRKYKGATLGAAYSLNDGSASLSWSKKPLKAILKGNIGKGKNLTPQAALMVTHEFDL